MKAAKIFGLIVLLIVLSLGGIAYYFLSNINSIVKTAIETVGTDIAKTVVQVTSVNIELTEGKGAIRQLSIANPVGFSDNNLLSVGDIALQIDIQSLTQDVIVIKNITVNEVNLRAEHQNLKDSNVEALLNNVNSGRSSSASPQPSSRQASENGNSDLRLMVETLEFGGGEITLASQDYGDLTLKLPVYTQNNIGNKSQGLSPEQLAQTIMDNLLDNANKRIKRGLQEVVTGRAKQEIEQKLRESLKDKVPEKDIDKLKGLFR